MAPGLFLVGYAELFRHKGLEGTFARVRGLDEMSNRAARGHQHAIFVMAKRAWVFEGVEGKQLSPRGFQRTPVGVDRRGAGVPRYRWRQG